MLFEIFVAGSGQIALAAASRGYALAVVCRLLIVGASLTEHRLYACAGFGSCNV